MINQTILMRLNSVMKYLAGIRYVFRTAAALCMLSFSLAANSQSIRVRDYNAIPNDTLDDAAGIQAALTAARTQNIHRVEFEAGIYYLKVVAAPSLNAYFGLTNFAGLQLAGAMNNGSPATWLVKHNPQLNNTVLPSHARFDHCNNLSMSGFVFDNTPQYATAGKVTEKGAGYIKVEVYDGLPAVDGMGCYTANIWDTITKNLKQLPSPSFIDDVTAENLFWQLTQSGGKNYMQMNSARFASTVNVGDGLSWHFGAQTMFQLAINYCDSLLLEDLLTVNIAGWGIQTMGCKNIQAKRVKFKANGKQLAVGPRDAWKMNSCNGIVDIDSMEVEGVRWDGQNVHGPFYQVKAKLSANTLRIYKRYPTVVPFINDTLAFWNDSVPVKRLATNWQFEQNADDGVYGIVTISDTVPAFVQTNTLITMYATDIDHYILKNSVFKNIAGCASVIKASKATIQNVSYSHIMYPAIVFGVENAEATFPQDILVEQCSFDASGWVSRNSTKGLVGIGNSGYTKLGRAMGTIHFNNCTFSNANVGIDAGNLKILKVTNSTFINVGQPFKLNSCTIGEVYLNNNNL
jgi:hypothetical protein